MTLTNNKTNKDYKIDARTFEDVKKQIRELAASYTPEWVFDPDNPDIGSVIALIFGSQLADSIDRLNQLPRKYRVEFVNMLNIGLLSAHPAQGVTVLELIRDTVSSVNVSAGTKLLGSKEDGGVTVFETLSDIHVTNSRLTEMMAIFPKLGKIIPLFNSVEKTDLIENKNSEEEEQNDASGNAGGGNFEDKTHPPFRLFDFSAEGVQQNALLMYHQSVFDTDDNVALSVRVFAPDGADLSAKLADGNCYKWSYYDGSELVPFSSVSAENGAVVLKRSGSIGKLRLSVELPARQGSDTEFSAVCVEAIGAVSESMDIKTLQISSFCASLPPSFINRGESEMNIESFMPFGEQASVFDEFYIGHDRIFKQQGANIILRFELSYREKLVTFTPQQADEQLKVIKRKPKQVLFDTARTCAEKISFEYFNGTGFKKLIFNSDLTTLFDGRINGSVEASFVCPDDWQPITSGGNTGRAIRVRLMQADNCYLQPCTHNMPLIKNLNLSYSYEGERKLPQKLTSVLGTQLRDFTPRLLSGGNITAFEPLPYNQNAVYLGFDRKINGSPVSLFFETEESARFSGADLKLEYSTLKGFSPLRIRDNTNGLSNSGTIMFTLGSDFAPASIEGRSRYWLRITGGDGLSDEQFRYFPVIKRILPNAVPVHNVWTMEEESFYIETATANMSFALPANNILSADVYVNERGLSQTAMQEFLKERPDEVKAEYDGLNRINDFFVKWSETENFDNSKPDDRHYVLDRMTNSIRFGDGAHVKIPMVTDSTAFTVQVKCCDGAGANLPAGAVNAVMGNILYVENIYNPVATYAGNDIEAVEKAVERGVNIINSKNRLVSELDFIREANAFSGMISQTECIIGKDADGNKKSGMVSLAVLMNDYADGSYSFEGIRERLKTRLLEKSEATLTESDLFISEPVFVTITVDVWVKTSDFSAGFETQNFITEHIRNFIEPVQASGGQKTSVRKIGELPTAGQLKVAFNSMKYGADIRYFSATARYVDSAGAHERELSALKASPFMLGINGEHKVHVL
ncbi:MAG: hypothetical protein FWG44_02195 [Oscillospiraceae bacterium]|nr:hypothetical protein [Oscillospiraceae bacterium]